MSVDSGNKVLRHTNRAVMALAAKGCLTAPELAKEIGIPRPSGYRLVNALISAGLAQSHSDGGIALSTEWLRFGDSAATAHSAWVRSDLIAALRDESGLTVYVAVPSGRRAVCVQRLLGRSSQVLVLKPGGSLPLHAGAVGRAILAESDQLSEYLADGPFPRFTEHTLTTAAQLTADVARTRERGYVLSDEDVTDGVAAVGTGVRNATGDVIGAVSVAGLRDEILPDEELLARLVRETATGMAY